MSALVVGTEIPAQNFAITRELLVAYANASGDQNPIHQDEAFAKSVGLPDVIAHGMLTMALAGKYISDIAGSSAVQEFSARFTKPVVVPAHQTVQLTVTAKVSSVEGKNVKLDITAAVGEVKVLGMAKASIVLP